jgi:hypothetical protein
VPATVPTPRASGLPGPSLVAPLLAAAAGVLVFHRALGFFFSQDDFLGLARASGLAPRLAGAWRLLSHQAFFDVMWPIAGLGAGPYHAVSLVSHTACAALLVVLLGRIASPPAAVIGGVFFAVHPALFGAVYWISAVGDSLALLGALGALLLALRPDRLRWASLPVFGLSLLAKESTLLLPAVVMLAAPVARSTAPAGSGPVTGPVARRRFGVCLGLAAVALLHLAGLLAGNAFGVRAGLPDQAPYAIGSGAHVGTNLLTYLGWTANFLLPTVRGVGDAADPRVFPWAIGLILVWLAGLFSRGLRHRGWFAAGATVALFLLPVLPLRHHTYHYYLYAALAGAAWCVAAAADLVLARVRSGRASWAIAGGTAALLALNGALLAHKIETMPFVLPELRSDPIVDRARIARNAYQSISGYELGPGTTLIFWSPTAASLGAHGERLGAPAPNETYWERNVKEALLAGLAVRVMFPQVSEVRFVRQFEPAPPDARYAVYRPEGRVRIATSEEVASILESRAASP